MFIPTGAAERSLQCVPLTRMARLTALMMAVVISAGDDGGDHNNFESSNK